MDMNNYFKIEDKIYGFCNGFFGRNSYSDKICVFVKEKYAVFESIEDKGEAFILSVYSFRDDLSAKSFVEDWKKPKNSYNENIKIKKGRIINN